MSPKRALEAVSRAVVHEPAEDCALLPDYGAAVCCTASAKMLADLLKGRVMGFANKDNPGANIAQESYGHDFCLLADGRIVDWWAGPDGPETAHSGVVETDDPKRVEWYGNPSAWVELEKEGKHYGDY